MSVTPSHQSRLSALVYPLTLRIVFFSIIWVILSGGNLLAGLPFAIPCIIIACCLAMALRGSERRDIRVGPLFFYLPFFLYKSLVSGVDVMLRVLDPRLPIDPGLIEYRLALPKGNPRIFLADIITLLPGTISVDLNGENIIIHALDKGMTTTAELRRLEEKVADLYGVDLSIRDLLF